MAIAPLPTDAVRALGSGQVLTDPVSLVKELLENSLDAGATAISIETSPNLLDMLQVRDNGYGIAPEDRDTACVRHHTSKIRAYADIATCRSLGFRGEALASAAELSTGMTFTTRVEGERVATVCEVARNGSVQGRRTIGAPVGTTVKATGFLKKLPVRRENALRHTARYIARLRALVAAYHLARPSCRFSLRILASPQKASAVHNEDVVYPPSKTVPEAVRKVAGKDVAMSCEWFDTTADENSGNDDGDEGDGEIALRAFLPKPSSDPKIICKKPTCSHYIFVDSRPVSCARGTLRKILTLAKSYLRSSLGALDDPFVYLNIICPGSYDANVEPAKDDVMFNNPNAVVDTVESLLKRVYGELPVEEGAGRTKKAGAKAVGSAASADVAVGELVITLGGKDNPVQLDLEQLESGQLVLEHGDRAPPAAERDAAAPSGSLWTAINPGGDTDGPRGEIDHLHKSTDATEATLDGSAQARDTVGQAGSGRFIDFESLGDDIRGQHPVPVPPSTPKRKGIQWCSTMRNDLFDLEDDDDGGGGRQDVDMGLPVYDDEAFQEELAATFKDPKLSNPWTTAKLNAASSSSPRTAPPLNVPPAAPRSPTALRSPITPRSPTTPRTQSPLARRDDSGNSSLLPGRTPKRSGPRSGLQLDPRKLDWGYPTGPQTGIGPGSGYGARSPGSTRRWQPRQPQSPPSNAGAMDKFVTRIPKSSDALSMMRNNNGGASSSDAGSSSSPTRLAGGGDETRRLGQNRPDGDESAAFSSPLRQLPLRGLFADPRMQQQTESPQASVEGEARPSTSPIRQPPTRPGFTTAANFLLRQGLKTTDGNGDDKGNDSGGNIPMPRPPKRRHIELSEDDDELLIPSPVAGPATSSLHLSAATPALAPAPRTDPPPRRTTNPHANRYHVATAALNRHIASVTSSVVPAPPAPAPALARVRRFASPSPPPPLAPAAPTEEQAQAQAQAPPAAKRRRTRSHLPLEQPPPQDARTVALVATLPPTSLSALRTKLARTRAADAYGFRAPEGPAVSMAWGLEESGMAELAEALEVLNAWFRRKGCDETAEALHGVRVLDDDGGSGGGKGGGWRVLSGTGTDTGTGTGTTEDVEMAEAVVEVH